MAWQDIAENPVFLFSFLVKVRGGEILSIYGGYFGY